MSCLDLVKKIVSTDYRRAHRGNQDRIQDLIQEGSLGLIDAAARFRPQRGPFSNWAALHIHAAIRRSLGSERRQPEAGSTDAGLAGVIDHRAGSDPSIDARAVRAAIADLPAADQYVLMRIFYDGASVGEVAAEHDVTPGAISHRKTRSLARLRKRLTA
jgi:RNA polymerase sigma-70 factor (ECF subfamily)